MTFESKFTNVRDYCLETNSPLFGKIRLSLQKSTFMPCGPNCIDCRVRRLIGTFNNLDTQSPHFPEEAIKAT